MNGEGEKLQGSPFSAILEHRLLNLNGVQFPREQNLGEGLVPGGSNWFLFSGLGVGPGELPTAEAVIERIVLPTAAKVRGSVVL
jgi:hypothetical protein